jgi:hypothetical protein
MNKQQREFEQNIAVIKQAIVRMNANGIQSGAIIEELKPLLPDLCLSVTGRWDYEQAAYALGHIEEGTKMSPTLCSAISRQLEIDIKQPDAESALMPAVDKIFTKYSGCIRTDEDGVDLWVF